MAGISADLLTDPGPPQVGITITGLDSAASSVVSVEVTWDGQTWHGVRGGDTVAMIGGGFIRDHVPPLNVQATYRLTVVAGAVTPATLTDDILIPSPVTWVQDPLNPVLAFPVYAAMPATVGQVVLGAGSLAQATWTQPVDYATPEGANLPVASIGTRQRASEVPLVLSYNPAYDSGQVRDLLLGAGQIVVRGLPITADVLDAVAYVTVDTATEVRQGTRVQWATWSLTVRQVRPTSLGIVVPWWTYTEVATLWAPNTYATVRTTRPGSTYLDWARDPRPPV